MGFGAALPTPQCCLAVFLAVHPKVELGSVDSGSS